MIDALAYSPSGKLIYGLLIIILQWAVNSGILWVVVTRVFRLEGTFGQCMLCILLLTLFALVLPIPIAIFVVFFGLVGAVGGQTGAVVGILLGLGIGLYFWLKWSSRITADTFSCSGRQGFTILIVYWLVNFMVFFGANIFMGDSIGHMGLGSPFSRAAAGVNRDSDHQRDIDFEYSTQQVLTVDSQERPPVVETTPTDSPTPTPAVRRIDAPTTAPTQAQTPEPTKTPLPPKKYAFIHQAVKKGDAQDVITHLELGVEVDLKDRYGSTPLDLAVREGHKEVTEVLLERGAKLNAKDRFGRTPLHWAAEKGHKEVAEALLAKGADLDAKDNGGKTALDLAQTKDHKDVVKLLQTSGKTE